MKTDIDREIFELQQQLDAAKKRKAQEEHTGYYCVAPNVNCYVRYRVDENDFVELINVCVEGVKDLNGDESEDDDCCILDALNSKTIARIEKFFKPVRLRKSK